MTNCARRRPAAGRIKAEQVRATGAKVVVAPCHNCIDQLSELNREHPPGIEAKTLAELSPRPWSFPTGRSVSPFATI